MQIIKIAHRKLQARCQAFMSGASDATADSAARAASFPICVAPDLEESTSKPPPRRAIIDASRLADMIDWFVRIRGVPTSTWRERPPIYAPHRLPRRDERCLIWRELPRPLPLETLRDNLDRLLHLLADDSHRRRGERLSPLQITVPTARGASLIARATAGATTLDVLLEQHHDLDALGIEQRTFVTHVMLSEIVPGITLQLMGNARPGVCCSKLQLEAMAIEWSPAHPVRSALTVARALARICEESEGASAARTGCKLPSHSP